MNMPNMEKGQALLMLILVVAIVISVASASSYRLITETQSSQQQQEVAVALAAADSGIEFGLKEALRPTFAPLYQFNIINNIKEFKGIDTQRSVVKISNILGSSFSTPKIQKDAQYTVYLNESANYTSPVQLYFLSTGTNCSSTYNKPSAFEIVAFNNNLVSRYLVDPCEIFNGALLIKTSPASQIIGKTSFSQYVEVFPQGMRFLIVRPIRNTLTLGVISNNLPNQGQIVRSEAYTTTGVLRAVEVQRSLPQMPAEFFVTQF